MQLLELDATQRVLVIAAHPDDETLATGGVIQRSIAAGAAVRVLIATDGENNAWPQRAEFKRWTISAADRAAWSERRRSEALEALGILGMRGEDAIFLNYPDGGLTRLLLAGSLSLIDALASGITEFAPTLVISPALSDLHPDHNALGLFTDVALGRSADPTVRHLRYVVHGACPRHASRQAFQLRLNPSEHATKTQAILAHRSQMVLSRRRFLSYATDHELFFEGWQSINSDPRVRAWASGAKEIVLRAPRTWLMNGTLTVATASGAVQLPMPRPRWLCDFARRSEAAPIVERQGSSQVKLCSMQRDDEGTHWIKLHPRWGFLDAFGWHRIVGRGPVLNDVRACCVIPCCNVARLCGPVVRAAARNADCVIVVDDGSTDDTRAVLEAMAAEDEKVQVLVHPTNLGKGAALLTAFDYALANLRFDVLVTLDGDGQHEPEDLARLVAGLRGSGGELAIAERNAFSSMPLRSRIGNELTSRLIHRIYPYAPKDTQSGFRALSRNFVLEINRALEGRRYDTELLMLLSALERGGPIATISIATVYIDGNRSSRFRPIVDSARIFVALLRWWSSRLLPTKQNFQKPSESLLLGHDDEAR